MRYPALFFTTALGLCGTAPAAIAQQQDDQELVTLEEIVVTARKRAETYQDVPITLTSFTSAEIQQAGIERPRDFIGLTPNVTLIESQSVGNAFIQIRGISQNRNTEPSVAVVIDGVLMSNPRAFNVELFDLESIQVLKGPQGALYGRNAIGGAIIIDTKEPSREFEGRVEVGADSGPGVKLKAGVSGPITDTLSFRASVSYVDTDGFIPNTFTGNEADPFRDASGRARLLWTPTENFSVDLRGTISQTEGQALWFNIVNDVDDTSLPVRVNNPGTNDRDIYDGSLKMDYETEFATLTSITAFNKTTELLTGDAFDFLPPDESLFGRAPDDTGPAGPPNGFPGIGLPFDLNQAAYFSFESWSQEFRFTSPSDQRFRWVAGSYFIFTDRLGTVGNQLDLPGVDGVINTKRNPTTPQPFQLFVNTPPVAPFPEGVDHPQNTFLSDAQDNFAWSFFADIAYDVTEDLEAEVSVRWDKDERKNITLTPQPFLALVNLPGFPQAETGDVRKRNFKELQPKFTLRYTPTEDLTLYTSYGKGFRSGGFNQTGVGPIANSFGIAGVETVFEEETTKTVEGGFKARLFGGRASLEGAGFYTEAKGSPFFVFIAQNSTQNVGNIGEVKHRGFEVSASARPLAGLDISVGFGFNDSKITDFDDPAAIGNEAPLVSRTNLNATLQYRRNIGIEDFEGVFRLDYKRIGKTWWEPFNTTVREPVDLVDLRGGIESDAWSLIGWVKNLNDEKFNSEFSPGGFVLKGPPRRWGFEIVRRF